jgi:L-malate glycosyltransferase
LVNNANINDDATKVRVLIIAPSLDILGGQSVQAERLLTRLSSESSLQLGFLPINPRLPGPFRKLQSIKYVRTLVTSIAYYLSLVTQVPRYDVIHIFSASYLSFLLSPTPAILIGKLFGRKLLLNYHSGEAEDHFRRWTRTAIPTIRMVDVVVVPSEYLVQVFSNFGLASKPIYNIIETSVFRFRKRDPLRPSFLSNRNFEAHYGVDTVLRAFAIVQQSVPDATLTVVGDGPLRDYLHKLASELKLNHVEFTGRVEHEHATRLYDSADVFLNGSSIDNQPLSILEAFASGLPVVTTNAGGIPYMVEDEVNALMSSVGDEKELAANVLRLLNEPILTARLVQSGLSECQKYDWKVLREQWLNVYHELAGIGASELSKEVPSKDPDSSHSNAKLEENQTA